MNVLSCFDGMSCGQLALERAGIPVHKYWSSEIDQHAMKVTKKNFPDTIQMGNICNIMEFNSPIDLIMGGSPCQGFSFAGKQLAFDDPRSALFFEFVRILKECNPKYFLLENVKMKKEFLDIITQQVGAEPILINSALVSAQNRQRYYWTNIPGVEQPENRGIVLRDILETNPDSYTLMSDKFSKRQEGRSCLVDMNKEKASNLSAMEYVKNGRQGDYLACDDTGIMRYEHPKDESSDVYWRKLTCRECERLQTVPDDYTASVSNTQRYKMLGNGWTIEVIAHILKNMKTIEEGGEVPKSKGQQGFDF